MADPEGWGQGLESGDGKPAPAVNDSNAKLNLTACPVHADSVSPEEQGPRKGQTPQRARQGHFVCPQRKGRTPTSSPSPRERRQRPRSKCLNCPAYNWTTRSVCRSCEHKLPPGELPQNTPLTENPGQASAKQGGGGPSFSGVSSGVSFAAVVKGETGPAENPQRREGHPAKERRVPRKTAGQHET